MKRKKRTTKSLRFIFDEATAPEKHFISLNGLFNAFIVYLLLRASLFLLFSMENMELTMGRLWLKFSGYE